ncbi:MAG: universal stress protein [Nocardioides sp.]|uniref:universal stress protein n=1 Tax=Nocardioides sp. TaxID=35761 RepID=UPI003F0CC232
MAPKIVVGVDNSITAAAAADRAATLAAALGAELHVVSAFGKQEVETVEIGHETFVISSADEARQLTESLAARLHLAHPELTVVTSGLEGRAATAITDHAESIGASLIVIGNKRVQGPSRVLGSIATAILHKAHCDVYVAHTHDH